MPTLSEINDAIKAGLLNPNEPRPLPLMPMAAYSPDDTRPGRPWLWQMAAMTRTIARRRRLFRR